jgi:hypothetical protein
LDEEAIRFAISHSPHVRGGVRGGCVGVTTNQCSWKMGSVSFTTRYSGPVVHRKVDKMDKMDNMDKMDLGEKVELKHEKVHIVG